MEMIKIAPLIEAINQVMASVNRVQKTGVNSHHRYNYASEEDLIEAIRPAMIEAGLVLMPGDVRILGTQDMGKNQRIDIAVDYHLHHKSGNGMKITVASSGIDSQDKAIPKAMTMALKYALIQTFLIPRSDNDPDQDQSSKVGGWNCNKTQFIRFANSIEGGSLAIYKMCEDNGWPLPESWNQDRLNNFIQAVKTGKLQIGGDREI